MKFRKKPIVVEAYQLTEEKEIHTREGTVKGYPGDWIITGIQGEVYPCGKEIFEQTYEPADTRRSRPAPSPQFTPTEQALIDACMETTEDPTPSPAPSPDHVMIYDADHPEGIPFPEYVNAQRAAAAAQALEDLLDEIIEWATPIRKNWPNNDCHRDPFDDIIKKAESLRTEGGERR